MSKFTFTRIPFALQASNGVSDCTNGSSGSDSNSATTPMLLSPATAPSDPAGSTTDENQEPSSKRRKMDAVKTSKAEDTFRYTQFIFLKEYVVQAVFMCTFFVQWAKVHLFSLPQFDKCPQGVTNILEDWADFWQCQEFWCHFLSFALERKNTTQPLLKRRSLESKGTFY